MFVRKKDYDKMLEELNNRLGVIEFVVGKLIDKIELQDKVQDNDVKLKEEMTTRIIENQNVIKALLKSDDDRIKALNLTMDTVNETRSDVNMLAKILSEKGVITVDDFKGD